MLALIYVAYIYFAWGIDITRDQFTCMSLMYTYCVDGYCFHCILCSADPDQIDPCETVWSGSTLFAMIICVLRISGVHAVVDV